MDKMLTCLVDLMSSKIDNQGNITNMDDYDEKEEEEEVLEKGQVRTGTGAILQLSLVP